MMIVFVRFFLVWNMLGLLLMLILATWSKDWIRFDLIALPNGRLSFLLPTPQGDAYFFNLTMREYMDVRDRLPSHDGALALSTNEHP